MVLLLENFHCTCQLQVCHLRLVCNRPVEKSHEYPCNVFTTDVQFNHVSNTLLTCLSRVHCDVVASAFTVVYRLQDYGVGWKWGVFFVYLREIIKVQTAAIVAQIDLAVCV